ncbi:uncharacterized protein LOC133460539 [Cololabis saira]|uniref:uncharacterized protein LOC133460539 n=1 Tax=Cololabis saira TaxID=129043 RepID=UPI002AD428B9|nr:uncharacterized protein LOC133460539 [Cololabis saira]
MSLNVSCPLTQDTKVAMELRGFCVFLQLALAAGLNADSDKQMTQFNSIPGNRDNDNTHQAIVIMEKDPAVIKSAAYLFKKHPSASTLLSYQNGVLHVLQGRPGFSGNYDVLLVGHGRKSTMGPVQLAGLDPGELARFMSILITKIGHSIRTVTLISCKLGNDQRFMLNLLQILHSAGVETKLHLQSALLSVNSNGEIMREKDGVWRSHDHSSEVIAQLNQRGDLLVTKPLGCSGPVFLNYKGHVLYLQTLEWPRHPQMFVPMELRKKYPSIDCLEGLTWSLFFEESERRRAPTYTPQPNDMRAVWLKDPDLPEEYIVLKHIMTIQDLLAEIRFNAMEEVTSDLYYVLNECIYKVHGKNLSVTLAGKVMNPNNTALIEVFRESLTDQMSESPLEELQQGLKASSFNDFCRQTFQFRQCIYNCERWGRYFMTAVFSASVRNFRTFSLFLMSVIGCEVGRLRGTDSSLCTAFVGNDHPMITEQPWPEHLRRGFYGCTVDNYEVAPENWQIWLDQVVAKENALYVRSKQMMTTMDHNDQTELDIFGRIKVMNKYVFSSYMEYFRGTPEGKKLKIGCAPVFREN